MSSLAASSPPGVAKVLKGLWSLRERISVRLYLAFGIAVFITFITSVLAIVAINFMTSTQNQVNQENVPKLEAAFSAAQLGNQLVSALPRMNAATNADDFQSISLDVETTVDAFDAQLLSMRTLFENDSSIDEIHGFGMEIMSNIDEARRLVQERFTYIDRTKEINTLVQGLQSEATAALVPTIDNQLFFALTGYREMEGTEATRAQQLSSLAIHEYRHLSTIYSSISEALQLLSFAFSIDDRVQVQPLSQQFDAAINRINRSLTYVSSANLPENLLDIIDRIYSLGSSEVNSFALRVAELELLEQMDGLIIRNEELVANLVRDMEAVVTAAQLDTAQSTAESIQVAKWSEITIIAFNVIAITGAVLLAWLWVGRRLINRIGRLAENMQTMASGNLEVEIDHVGSDEVAHMATALEVFRKHALEVQRLNLVESLAKELQEKNQILEQTNIELEKAKDQIVMREKLAALGELTAGVAHEIKNPMNFIINFSDVSGELVEELTEELELLNDDASEEFDKGLIEEICADLKSNMERISGHGQRANRIVVDMLSMGRGSAEWQPCNLNELIETHINLAFHSQRGQDSEFQLKIDLNLSDEIGEVIAVPQDLGRVFLNITANACHATDEKRKEIEQAKGIDSGYMPTLTVSSRKTNQGYEIDFADNGPGMSQEVIEKIFQPFFTTKDPNSGTGLGMSLSHDIVRQHRGEIKLKTEVGVGSTLTVFLPNDPSATASEPSSTSIADS